MSKQKTLTRKRADKLTGTDIVIPAGYTKIGYAAFHERHDIERIIIPEGVTVIENYAFYVNSIVSLKLPESLIRIGNEAISRCDYLEELTIPCNVRHIGKRAFSGCRTLAKLTISKSVKYIGKNAFDGCEKLIHIHVEEGNPSFSTLNGVLCNKDKTLLIKYLSATPTKNYTIPNGVKKIADDAFRSCENLTQVNIPESVVCIGEDAFLFCNSLQAINVERTNAYFTGVRGILFSKDKNVLLKCPGNFSGKTVTVPGSVMSIAKYAFYQCTSIKNIKLSDGVESIGASAFFGCKSLRYMHLPDSVKHIGNSAFGCCRELKYIRLPAGLTSIESWVFSSCTYLESIEIPESVISIEPWCFQECLSLKTVTLPKSVITIGERMFTGCYKLKTINVAEDNPVFSDIDGVLFNKDKTALLRYPPGIDAETYTVPNGVKTLGAYAFDACKLSNIILPDGLETIDKDAINGHRNIKNIILPKSVKRIVTDYKTYIINIHDAEESELVIDILDGEEKDE